MSRFWFGGGAMVGFIGALGCAVAATAAPVADPDGQPMPLPVTDLATVTSVPAKGKPLTERPAKGPETKAAKGSAKPLSPKPEKAKAAPAKPGPKSVDPQTTGALPPRPPRPASVPVQPGNPVISVQPPLPSEPVSPGPQPADDDAGDAATGDAPDSTAPGAGSTAGASSGVNGAPQTGAPGLRGQGQGSQARQGQAPTGQSASGQTLTTGSLRLRQTVPATQPQSPVAPQAPSSQAQAPLLPRQAISPNPQPGSGDPLADTTTAYDPIGINSGGFNWKPAIESSVGYSTNATAAAGGKGAAALRLAPELTGTSNWERHSLSFSIRSSLTDYPDNASLYRPTVDASATGRIDLSEGMRIDLKAGYNIDRITGSSVASVPGTSQPGLQQTLTGSAGVTRDMGLFALTLRGDVDRTDYSQSLSTSTTGGAVSSLNNTHMVVAVRGTYNATGAFKPFVEVQATDRHYDTAPASAAAQTAAPNRDSTGYGIKSGAVVDFGPALSGEASAGYGTEKAADAGLRALRAMTTDASLVWSPTRLTAVTVTAATAFEPTLIAGASGSVSHTYGVKASQELTRNLTAELGGSVLLRTYTGISRDEHLASATTGLVWKFNRNVQTFVRGTYDDFSSTAKSDNYRAATVFAGVRLQQ